MSNFKEKVKDLTSFCSELDRTEKRIVLKYIIMHDLKLYTDVLFEEQKRLEKECGIAGVESYEEFEETPNFDGKDGYVGYCGGEKT